jgi:hypothetical protein
VLTVLEKSILKEILYAVMCINFEYAYDVHFTDLKVLPSLLIVAELRWCVSACLYGRIINAASCDLESGYFNLNDLEYSATMIKTIHVTHHSYIVNNSSLVQGQELKTKLTFAKTALCVLCSQCLKRM